MLQVVNLLYNLKVNLNEQRALKLVSALCMYIA
jgi:hypothetical protein